MASSLAAFTLLVVGTIDVFYFLVGLPRWLRRGLPPVPAPPPLSPEDLARSGEADCFPRCCHAWSERPTSSANIVISVDTCTAEDLDIP